MITINSKIEVNIGGTIFKSIVAGLDRPFGKNSAITVKFFIDYDEGPLEYKVPIHQVKEIVDCQLNSVTIGKDRYEELLDIEHQMICLQNAGIDNAEAYGEGMRQYHQEKQDENHNKGSA